MDPALLKQREEFKRKAIANPVVEKRLKRAEDKPKSKKNKTEKKEKREGSAINYQINKNSPVNFAVLNKIVTYMKDRHHRGDKHGLTLEEILDETNQSDISSKQKAWLTTGALSQNPKIQSVSEGKFTFKPPYDVPSRKVLLKLVERHYTEGLGGILYDDVEESMANAAKAVKSLSDKGVIFEVIRQPDKKRVLFYNDQKNKMNIDEKIVTFWRTITVENMDECKIEDYLQRHHITSMKDTPVTSKDSFHRRKKAKTKPKKFKRLNEHLSHILQEYDPDMKK